MDEFDGTGMQVDAAIGIRPWEPILQVALDVQPDLCQLRPDLVVPSRVQLNLQQEKAVALRDGLIRQRGIFRPFHLLVVGIRLVHVATAGDVVLQGALRWYRSLVDHRPVNLPDLVLLLEHLVEASQHLAGACHQHNAAGRTVNPVGEAQEHIPRLVVFLLDIGFHLVGQRRVAGLVDHDNLAALLVDGNQVVIFENDLHGLR